MSASVRSGVREEEKEAPEMNVKARCTVTTYDGLAEADTRCRLVPGHEDMHDDGCLRWWDPLPRHVLGERWGRLAVMVKRLADAETDGDKSDVGARIATELQRLAGLA